MAVVAQPTILRRRSQSPARVFLRRLFREKPLGAAGAVVFVLFLFCGIFADLLAPYGMNQINPINRLKPPSWAFPFGTDNLGRDMLSRCLYGAQLSVIIGFCAAGLATFISVFLGIITGYLGGKIDLIIQRFVDAWQSFPDLIILIVVVSVVGPGMPQIIVTLGLLLGIAGSRIIRSAVVSVRENMYVHAAQSIGASTPRILWRHILPNVLPPIIVLFTTRVGFVILAESGLSFLGLGVPPPAPTWGGMLSGSGRSFMFQGPWLALAPGLCLTVVVYATNVFGDALRDIFDPRMRGGRADTTRRTNKKRRGGSNEER
jgi:peptide/nickel transport system permease protein